MTAVLTSLLCLLPLLPATAADAWPDRLHAFDNGLTRTKPIAEKVRALKELGYAGVGGRPGQLAEWLPALDSAGLEMTSLYVTLPVGTNAPALSPDLITDFEKLQGRATIIWLSLLRGDGADDALALGRIREVAAHAQRSGLRVALYPHATFYTETVGDVVRLADQVNLSNVGTSFNLCHFLKTDQESNLETALSRIAPRLWLISINGADTGDTQAMGWDRLIQPLGKGTFDNQRLLQLLQETGYSGPVVLQSYAIPGADRENLRQSMSAWQALCNQVR